MMTLKQQAEYRLEQKIEPFQVPWTVPGTQKANQ
jgi:hypothetical protein